MKEGMTLVIKAGDELWPFTAITATQCGLPSRQPTQLVTPRLSHRALFRVTHMIARVENYVN